VELPKTFLALGITLRTDDRDRNGHIAHLAGRIGYAMAWLEVPQQPTLSGLRDLAAAAAPARLGLIIPDVPAAADWLAATRDDPVIGTLPLEVPGGADDRPVLIDALGESGYATRAYPRTIDLTAAGHVVAGPDEADIVSQLRTACARRTEESRSAKQFPLLVDVGVSIGRTMGEAEARVLRDPTLAARTDLRTAGVFGTFEDAQQRVLAYARAGADGLRATLAEEHDVADLLAHLRAVTVGPVGVLLARREPPKYA
jgi:hypothetical protein